MDNKKINIAISGNQGSFSHEAANFYIAAQELKDTELIYAIDSYGAFDALDKKEADLIIIPIHNVVGGLVHMTLDSMSKYTFRIEEMFEMNIQQCIMIKPGKNKEDITTIVSHPQALQQCYQYLLQNWAKREQMQYADTAQAAKDLAEGKLPDTNAAIAPKTSAEIYGLELVGESIQDLQFNITTFLVIKARE